jgi:thiamine biosynthesis protein ThiI
VEDRDVTVDLSHPDVTIQVDLAGEHAYVYAERFPGPGGLPLSSQWKMLAVMDSGPLTLLAAYAMMRRGCLVELFIPLSDTISTFASEHQLNLARKLRELVTRPSYKGYTVDFESLLGKGPDRPPDSTASRRLVRMAAVKFAKEKRFKGIIFADVAGVIDPAENLDIGAGEIPVFTPLIGLESGDLTEMRRLAGFPEAELPNERLGQPESAGLTFDLTKRVDDAQIQELSL